MNDTRLMLVTPAYNSMFHINVVKIRVHNAVVLK